MTYSYQHSTEGACLPFCLPSPSEEDMAITEKCHSRGRTQTGVFQPSVLCLNHRTELPLLLKPKPYSGSFPSTRAKDSFILGKNLRAPAWKPCKEKANIRTGPTSTCKTPMRLPWLVLNRSRHQTTFRKHWWVFEEGAFSFYTSVTISCSWLGGPR